MTILEVGYPKKKEEEDVKKNSLSFGFLSLCKLA